MVSLGRIFILSSVMVVGRDQVEMLAMTMAHIMHRSLIKLQDSMDELFMTKIFQTSESHPPLYISAIRWKLPRQGTKVVQVVVK